MVHTPVRDGAKAPLLTLLNLSGPLGRDCGQFLVDRIRDGPRTREMAVRDKSRSRGRHGGNSGSNSSLMVRCFSVRSNRMSGPSELSSRRHLPLLLDRGEGIEAIGSRNEAPAPTS